MYFAKCLSAIFIIKMNELEICHFNHCLCRFRQLMYFGPVHNFLCYCMELGPIFYFVCFAASSIAWIAWIFAYNGSCCVCLINTNMNTKTVPVSLSTLRRRTRVDVQKGWPRYDVSVVRTCDNYKDALKIMQQYRNGCNTSDLQSEAENEVELPEKTNRKPVHRLGDSDDSEEDPGNGDLASLGLASQLHWQTPPSRRVPARVIRTRQLNSSTGDNFLAAEVQILSLLETIKHTQDQLMAKVNFLTSRLTIAPGPKVEMPANIQFPLEQLEAVEAFDALLNEPSNGPARQRVISSLATI
ncbi:uncharacterized protein LOC133554818 isoform X2 [Nerophis ophidion]|uniref:uncharacterized protein LOC133554818 isoform X2 n=1 Tax=Nerophis ophidion TaxID=159077 RepID=UPI002AE0AD4B|nr:uncharacterized protein LOC133554818 isoform X2 [Nerophis ophidion]